MKVLATITALLGFLAVAFGAFGSHALKQAVEPDMLNVWHTAVQYQMFHTLALLATLAANYRNNNSLLITSGWLFVVGIVLFSGSLCLYVMTSIKIFAMITPVGGVIFLIGWLVLGFALPKITK